MSLDGDGDVDEEDLTVQPVHSPQDQDPILADLLRLTAEAKHVPLPELSSSYLDSLTSLPLHDLLREPAQIVIESTSVESELINLCFREYPTFISVHNCSAAVQSAFDDFDASLGQLIDSIPVLEQECRLFASKTSKTQGGRGRAALVQEHQDKLLDLLEIPHLMESSVRHGYYQEAMELATHAETLVRRYQAVALVMDVAKEVEGVLEIMLTRLVALLRDPIKLPSLVKTVGFLRRLGSIDEEELGLVFLASRLHNFHAQSLHLDRDRAQPVRYLRRYLDLFREHIYDIISQFSAIFDAPSLLVSFASHCIGDLIHLIELHVPRIAADSASLSSILVQLGYCAISFARVGFDFAALIPTPFVETIVSTYAQSIRSATRTLSSTLRDAAKTAAEASILVAADHPDLSSLNHFPPLAIFVNAHLSALNALRLLAPVEAYSRLTACQTQSLSAATLAIIQYLQQASARRDGNEPPASPRAHLLRRSSETQMTAEMRDARRRETIGILLTFATAFRDSVVPMLSEALKSGIFEEAALVDWELQEKLGELEAWIDEHREATAGLRSIKENGEDSDAKMSKTAMPSHLLPDLSLAADWLSPIPGGSSETAMPTPLLPTYGPDANEESEDQPRTNGERVSPPLVGGEHSEQQTELQPDADASLAIHGNSKSADDEGGDDFPKADSDTSTAIAELQGEPPSKEATAIPGETSIVSEYPSPTASSTLEALSDRPSAARTILLEVKKLAAPHGGEDGTLEAQITCSSDGSTPEMEGSSPSAPGSTSEPAAIETKGEAKKKKKRGKK